MLSEDVHVDQTKGEWLGFDFDSESLNFTAEFVGPVTQEQVDAFHAAFDGTTSLRRSTIAQFASIAEAIGEDELIGFGLYLKDQTEEPAEWRCLSRRDALRISEEMKVLLGASEVDRESHLPAIANSSGVARIFAERERGVEPTAKWTAYVRYIEANLDRRITRVEQAIEDQTGRIGDLHTKSSATEESVRRLLGAVEGFCAQTTRQLASLTGPHPVLPITPESAEGMAVPAAQEVSGSAEESNVQPLAEEPQVMRAVAGVYAAAARRAAEYAQAPAAGSPPESLAGVYASAASRAADEEQRSGVDGQERYSPEAVEDSTWKQRSVFAQPQRRNWQVAMGAALLAMGVIFLTTWVWQSFLSDGPSQVTAAATGTASGGVAPATAASPTIPAGTPAGAATQVSASNVPANGPAPAVSTPVASTAATPTPRATTPPTPGAATTEATPVIPAGGVRLQASEATWVAIRDAEGKTTLARLFNPGDEQSIEVNNGSRLRVGNAGGLQVYLNGKSVGPLGAKGQVREMIFRDGGISVVPSQP